MRDELLPMMDTMGYRIPAIELHHIGSEDFPPEPESLDCCLSSPPYGSHEKYSDEPSQSYIRFSSNEEWLNGYMRTTLENCWAGLKPNGWLVINVADCSSYPTLTSDFLELAKGMGFRLVETLQLALSKMVGTDKWSATHKYEPVFAFRKSPTRTLHILTAELKNDIEHQLGVGLMPDYSKQIASAATIAQTKATAAIDVSKPAAAEQTLVTIEPKWRPSVSPAAHTSTHLKAKPESTFRLGTTIRTV
jgi:DNA modification methylase